MQQIAAHTRPGSFLGEATAAVASQYSASLEAFSSGDFATARRLAEECRAMMAPYVASYRSQLPTADAELRCTIVVVTYRDQPDFLHAMQLIADEAMSIGRCEVIIVDNGNGTARAIAEHYGWQYIHIGFNYGCSGGRNVGAALARAKYVVFLDDDGFLEPNSVHHLLDAIEKNHAAAVRGRVIPKHSDAVASASYDLGPNARPAPITQEGISVFRTGLFVESGGFDPLLNGHEGNLLSVALVKTAGPFSVLYEPRAVLRHDYAMSEGSADLKRARIAKNLPYLQHVEPEMGAFVSALRTITKSSIGAHKYAVGKVYAPYMDPDDGAGELPPVSIITTAHNSSSFLNDYVQSLIGQTHRNFELVFVDDGSSDDTVARIVELFSGDPRLRVIESEYIGRSAALNIAIKQASHDICLIADADDTSTRHRLAATARLLREREDLDCLALWIFTKEDLAWSAQPRALVARDFRVRSLFGTPAPFPAFAFRRPSFKSEFDPGILAGVDFDWIARNMREHGVKGEVFPIYGSYYRKHLGQISSTKGNDQRATALYTIIKQHEFVCGELSPSERQAALILSAWDKPTRKNMAELLLYQSRLLSCFSRKFGDVFDQLETALTVRIAELELALAKVHGRPQVYGAPGIKESSRLLLEALHRRIDRTIFKQ